MGWVLWWCAVSCIVAYIVRTPWKGPQPVASITVNTTLTTTRDTHEWDPYPLNDVLRDRPARSAMHALMCILSSAGVTAVCNTTGGAVTVTATHSNSSGSTTTTHYTIKENGQ